MTLFLLLPTGTGAVVPALDPVVELELEVLALEEPELEELVPA
jgi:hypothetical protein